MKDAQNNKFITRYALPLVLVLALVLACFSFVSFPAVSVFADTHSDNVNELFRIDNTKTNFAQGNYDVEFSSTVDLQMKIPNDGFISFDGESDKTVYQMEYTLRLNNTELYYLKNACKSEFYFDFYRADCDEKSVAKSVTLLTRFMYVADYAAIESNKNYGFNAFLRKDYVYNNATFNFSPMIVQPEHIGGKTYFQKESGRVSETGLGWINENSEDWTMITGFFKESSYNHFNWSFKGSTPIIKFIVQTTDPDASYFCRFNYKVAEWAHDYGFLGTGLGAYNYEKEVLFGGAPTNNAGTNGGTVQSPFASPYSLLKGLRERGDLENTFTGREYEKALEVLDKVEFKNITVQRLVQIDDTPFATTKQSVVRVPVRSDGVFYDNVCAALGETTLEVLGAYPKQMLKLTSDGVYSVEYLASTWFHAKNADGYNIDMFLDINSSYKDFYETQTINTATDGTNNAIISPQMLEYFINQIKTKYPALERYGTGDIYGYWCFMAIPQTYTLDDVFQNVFGVATQYKGIAKYFRYERLINASAYKRILADYQYNWLQTFYNSVGGVVDGFKADYYMLYIDYAGEAVISDNGSTDQENNTGLIINKGQEAVTAVLDWIGNLASAPLAWVIVIGAVALIVFFKLKSGGKKRR